MVVLVAEVKKKKFVVGVMILQKVIFFGVGGGYDFCNDDGNDYKGDGEKNYCNAYGRTEGGDNEKLSSFR